jgi:hypothetical protein
MRKAIYIINLLLVFLIVRYEYISVSDKTIIITSFLYTGLVVMNFVIGFLAKLDKNGVYKYYYRSALIMLLIVVVYAFVSVVLPPSM